LFDLFASKIEIPWTFFSPGASTKFIEGKIFPVVFNRWDTDSLWT
jgi:hypothetical protein